jgi:serine/threonine protein kinase
MAIVYLGYHQSLRREVAVKVLLPGLTHDPSFVERFMREARVVARLNHPNIVQVHTVDRIGELQYLVMDYADGGTLQHRLAAGQPLDLPSVLTLSGQVADALDYAHSQGVVHRDIKPSNILLTQDGRAMLADFGIAVAVEQTRLTLTGGRWGTPEYMAPEQALGHSVGPATDVYALGAVVYQMATGRVPFQADTPIALLHQHVYNAPPSPRKFNRQVTVPVESAILQALEKAPDARFPSAGAFARALQGQPAARQAPPPRQRGAPAVAGLLLALVLVFGLLAGLALLRNCDTMGGMPEPTTIGTLPVTTIVLITQVTATEELAPATAMSPPVPTPISSLEPVTWTPSPWPTATPLPSWTPTTAIDPLWQAIEEAIWRYAEIKAVAIGPTHDDSQLSTVLTGEALKEQNRAVRWQRNNGAHYDTTLHWMKVEWTSRLDDTHAEALVTKKETTLYYPKDWTTPSTRLSCVECEYQVIYRLERIGASWYIAEKIVQDQE